MIEPVVIPWHRSSRCSSESACAEVAWTRSTGCESGSCAEVAAEPDRVLVRNSRRPHVVVEFDAAEWAAFLNGVTEGEFRVPQ